MDARTSSSDPLAPRRAVGLEKALRRLPIRVRLTIAFAGVIAVVLATAGVLLSSQFRTYIDAATDSQLAAHAMEAKQLVAASGSPVDALLRSGERLAQVYDADGRVVASTRALSGARLLTPAEARSATRGGLRLERTQTPRGAALVRALVLRREPARPLTVAVGEQLNRRDDALGRLRLLLMIAGPLALMLATYAGYQVAGAALRPVERMRLRAQSITDRDTSERLPVPATNDEIEALGHTLNELLARLDSALRRERRLLSDASHELRTPLAVLHAEVQLALRGRRTPDELRDALERVARQSDRLNRLAEDLLVFARADQGRPPIRREPVSARDLLEGAALRSAAAARAAHRRVEVGEADELALRADPDRAAQAVDNLVANALLHGRGDVELSARRTGDSVELHVADHGSGFPPGLTEHAFERFTRGETAGPGTGAGLGLAIVAAIAQAHGGEAGARNLPGGGADVWLSLPAAAEAPLVSSGVHRSGVDCGHG
jgi:two-component system, OmpR family, sensor kinase